MKIVLHFIAALLLLILGWFTYSFFFDFSMEQLKPNQVDFQSTDLTYQVARQLYFALLLASLPLIGLIIQSLLKLKDSTQIVLLYALMVISAILFWQIRISIIEEEMRSFDAYSIGRNVKSTINIEDLKFVNYLVFGVVLAALIFFALKKIFAPQAKEVEL